ncbi:MAG: aspartate carbamoyltransferase regulatory subunit, partial [Candidatus Thermoplasmatota archaeon]|nr:aspartate carbamoyltransferase regulatory subunit [Candidatus Thermoplasmatota archaeon]
NGKKGKKDIVKIENRELDPKEVDKIALIAPKATINIIRDYEVVKKHTVQLPEEVIGLTKCSNPTCITNTREPVESRFQVICKDPVRIRCYFCEREPDDIAAGIV